MSIIHRQRQTTGVAGPLSPEASSLEARPMNPVSAALLRVFGPADSPDNPLVGTKYDPQVSARRELERTKRRHEEVNAVWQRWDKRLHGHNPAPRYRTVEDDDDVPEEREPGTR